MFNKLRSAYIEQQFFPTVLGIFINPFYFARRNLSHAVGVLAQDMHGRLLDVGCGTKPYRKLFCVNEYIGLDIDSEIARQRNIADDFYDGYRFPYADQTFDSLLCNQVLEHVFNPDEFLQEIYRVLKPSGKMLLTVPFVWDEHEQPYDYARYSSFGLKALLEKNGFCLIHHQKLGNDATVLFQLTNAYLFKVIQEWPKWLRLLFTITVIAFFNLLGIVAGKLLPINPDLFLDHVVLVEKKCELLCE